MFNRILVPLDGSTLAERAIPHAEQFARIFGSTIILLQVLEPSSYQGNPNPVDPLSWQIRKTEADMYLQSVVARILTDLGESTTPAGIAPAPEGYPHMTEGYLRSKEGSASHPIEGSAPAPEGYPRTTEGFTEGSQLVEDGLAEKKNRVKYSIREGKIAEHIVDFAQSENIDLLILTTHGSGGLSRWNISSVVQKVIDLIYLPVLIVRAYESLQEDAAHIRYHRILLPIDSSRRAECSLYAGIALAQGEMALSHAYETSALSASSSGTSAAGQAVSIADTAAYSSKLLLSAIIKPPEIPIPEPYPPEIQELTEQLMHVSREAVNNYLNDMKGRLPVETEVFMIENNNVSTAIHEKANEEDVDLVILCAHGYTGQFTWPYGTVTRNYIEHGTKPVLVIQDIPRSQVRPTAAEIAAKKTGRR